MSKIPPPFRPTWSWLLERPARLFAFGFGSGLAPKAPGTVGSLVAVPIAGLFLGLGYSKAALALWCIPLFFCGIWLCNQTENDLCTHDYGGIVWDEIVAMLLVFACIPQGLGWWLFGFAAFRFFDAVKPPPVRWFDQKYGGGLGIMLDDIIAAIMAIILVNLFAWW